MAVDTSDARSAETAPRIAILSMRDINNHISRSCGYTFEDVIATELDAATLFSPQEKDAPEFTVKTKSWLSRHSLFGGRPAPNLTSTPLKRDFDMFFFYAAQPRDLNYLDAMNDWRQRSGFAICWLQELWVEALPSLTKALAVLNKFDHVICPFYHSTQPLRDLLQVPVTYLPWGVDTKLLCPFPAPPVRAIDIANIGDGGAPNHETLIDYAEATGKFYSYNTIHGRHGMKSHTAHRRNYADTLRRSKYLLTYVAKVARHNERGTQREFGLRYIEGVAAGAVLLGDRLSNPAFEEYLGWVDAVIDAPYELQDITGIINDLEADPKRVTDIRRRNIIGALSQHDHLHRWEKVLEIAGMKPAPELATRQGELNRLIDSAKNAPEGAL